MLNETESDVLIFSNKICVSWTSQCIMTGLSLKRFTSNVFHFHAFCAVTLEFSQGVVKFLIRCNFVTVSALLDRTLDWNFRNVFLVTVLSCQWILTVTKCTFLLMVHLAQCICYLVHFFLGSLRNFNNIQWCHLWWELMLLIDRSRINQCKLYLWIDRKLFIYWEESKGMYYVYFIYPNLIIFR